MMHELRLQTSFQCFNNTGYDVQSMQHVKTYSGNGTGLTLRSLA